MQKNSFLNKYNMLSSRYRNATYIVSGILDKELKSKKLNPQRSVNVQRVTSGPVSLSKGQILVRCSKLGCSISDKDGKTFLESSLGEDLITLVRQEKLKETWETLLSKIDELTQQKEENEEEIRVAKQLIEEKEEKINELTLQSQTLEESLTRSVDENAKLENLVNDLTSMNREISLVRDSLQEDLDSKTKELENISQLYEERVQKDMENLKEILQSILEIYENKDPESVDIIDPSDVDDPDLFFTTVLQKLRDYLNKIKKETTDENKRLEQVNAQILSRLDETENALKKLEREFKENKGQLEDENTGLKEELFNMGREHSEELYNLTTEHESEIERLVSEQADKALKLKETHAEEVANLNEEYS